MDFGTTIRQLRTTRGLTQRALAERLQLAGLKADVTYISKIENNRTHLPPSTDLIRALAALLETDSDALLLLAGKVDTKALQARIREFPELGQLIHRLQSRPLTQQQIQDALAALDHSER
jgi:transcriptional regulator with XRE-family HTH domain